MSTLDQEIIDLKTWSASKTLSLSLRNCTGTINGSFYYSLRNDNKAMMISGRVYISNFSRTGANPGFTFANATGFPSSGSYSIGFRGESPIESVGMNFSSKTITSNETFSNCSGTRLTFMVPITTFYF